MKPPRAARRAPLIILLSEAAQELVDELVERLGAAGYADIRPAHRWVFAYIDRDGTRLTDLAERARMTHPSMSELVTGLERAGYVERFRDPSDGRTRLVRLTAAGRRLQRISLAEIAEIERAWLRHLGPRLARELPAALASARLSRHAQRP